MEPTVPTFKVTLLGDGGVGKVGFPQYQVLNFQANHFLQTVWLKRLLCGEFEKHYIATLGVEVHLLKFSTVREASIPHIIKREKKY